MDYIQINRMTQDRVVKHSRDNLYSQKYISKTDAIILITHSLKAIYGVRLTAKIIHSLGVDKIDFSL